MSDPKPNPVFNQSNETNFREVADSIHYASFFLTAGPHPDDPEMIAVRSALLDEKVCLLVVAKSLREMADVMTELHTAGECR